MPSKNKSNKTKTNDELREKMERIWDKAKVALKRGHSEVLRVGKVGKLKLDSTSLSRQRDRLLMEIGEKVCAMIEHGGLNAAELEESAKRVAMYNREIEQLEKEIDTTTQKPEANSKKSSR